MTRVEELRRDLDKTIDQLTELVSEVMDEIERQDDLLMRVADIYVAEGRLPSTPQAISAWVDGDRQEDPPGAWIAPPRECLNGIENTPADTEGAT